MHTVSDIGAAIRTARIALALPIEALARELGVPPSQLRAIEQGSLGLVSALPPRRAFLQRLLARLQLPADWSEILDQATSDAHRDASQAAPSAPSGPPPAADLLSATPTNAPNDLQTIGHPSKAGAGVSTKAGMPAPVGVLAPPPVTARRRAIALGIAAVLVSAAIGAAFVPVRREVLDDTELEDLRSSKPSGSYGSAKSSPVDAVLAPPAPAPGAEGSIEMPAKVSAADSARGPAPSAQSATVSASTDRPYAVLPGSQLAEPQEPAALDLRARYKVEVSLLLEQGPVNLELNRGDRVVLLSGRPDRVEVSDRHAVELHITGQAASLQALPPSANASGAARGFWSARP